MGGESCTVLRLRLMRKLAMSHKQKLNWIVLVVTTLRQPYYQLVGNLAGGPLPLIYEKEQKQGICNYTLQLQLCIVNFYTRGALKSPRKFSKFQNFSTFYLRRIRMTDKFVLIYAQHCCKNCPINSRKWLDQRKTE